MDDTIELSPDPTDVIFFMFFGLIIGIIVTQILTRIGDPVPYTVVIFLLGVLLSIDNSYANVSVWTDSIEKWSKIDAELLLFVFLPPLIFGKRF